MQPHLVYCITFWWAHLQNSHSSGKNTNWIITSKRFWNCNTKLQNCVPVCIWMRSFWRSVVTQLTIGRAQSNFFLPLCQWISCNCSWKLYSFYLNVGGSRFKNVLFYFIFRDPLQCTFKYLFEGTSVPALELAFNAAAFASSISWKQPDCNGAAG